MDVTPARGTAQPAAALRSTLLSRRAMFCVVSHVHYRRGHTAPSVLKFSGPLRPTPVFLTAQFLHMLCTAWDSAVEAQARTGIE